VKVLYNRARIHYEANHFDTAARLFEEIVVKHPKDELARFSANLLLDCLNVLRLHGEFREWAHRLRSMGLLE
jgi:hypothetical protein